jgi:hypothetical protein
VKEIHEDGVGEFVDVGVALEARVTVKGRILPCDVEVGVPVRAMGVRELENPGSRITSS